MNISSYGPADLPESLFECAVILRDTIVGLTTRGGSEATYKAARTKLMEDDRSKRLLPNFVRHSMDAQSLQSALSIVASGSGSWGRRRTHVLEAFAQLLTFLESEGAAGDTEITRGLSMYDAPSVQAMWTKALERRLLDPEGAVTAASTLLEEVCKHIIEDSGGQWEKGWNIPKLYSETSRLLNLAPSQHQEEVFKSILGSCQNVVQGLGALRNGIGDAHAGGRSRVAVRPRHAALAVNLSGSMALFLIETWQERLKLPTSGS